MMAVSVATPPATRLTPGQRQRRQRILDAAVALAAEGGYDAVQMREVSLRAEVALGTLYRYFPSKEHLLVSALADQVDALRARLDERPPRGEDDAERVMDVIRRSTRALQRQPTVISAMLKSLISRGAGVGEAVEPIGAQMTEIVVSAMRHDDPETVGHDRAVAEVIQQVWLASLLWWAAGRAPAGLVEEKVGRAVVLLLPQPR